MADSTDPLKLALNEISYKPFISLFNITQATTVHPEIAGIGACIGSLWSHCAHRSLIFVHSELCFRRGFRTSSGLYRKSYSQHEVQERNRCRLHRSADVRKRKQCSTLWLHQLVIGRPYRFGDMYKIHYWSSFQPAAINNTAQWCQACAQSSLRGCAGCTI